MVDLCVEPDIIVLIVEDEPLLMLLAVSIVEDAGYVALEAGSAAAAIIILESRTDIRIVFSDVGLPGDMDGLKLANLIRDRWPPIALLLTSGRPLPGSGELPAGGIFIPKPYQSEEVTDALHELAA
ncbi:response regulator receiver protein [Methylocella silvestris BL2]|uniref:Response regulator receiver protein n=1 Tax=Methylocella silvestris (strain DSM 15510 / CIP 108128 / LMG 27833 / NCIMB 13906 / BL2) TaxID=395965 RepID=B8ES15_METSB|nr:response regulator [Methylocella silvestris]ACK51713.1 response regulator receiver protein [Methylocella silvestris BL2]